ncbi:MAG: Glu-tRNA(Gln) amidotransferase subunit GatD [Candidatus Pacearchaeota archaeon]|nr:Glu-tRNA(Gln) amidotransferase subunit GatD [Candidatus Pacearchaeota archaeon]
MKIENKPEPGDLVEIFLIKNSYKGIFLESPESEKGIFLLKLDSGYNIGLNKKDIFEIKVLKKSSEKKEKIEVKKDKEKPNIAMIITGGTIAARLNPKKGGVDWLDTPESLFKFYPELFKIVNVTKVEVPFMKASEDMDYKDWQKIAKTAQKFLNDSNINGIIITHGTDTLHYTSAALSFFLKDLNKPVVLTYSQRSIDRASSDASLNLECAAIAAISDIAEVFIVGHASSNDDFCYALRGTKVRKLHSSRRDAFKPVNTEPIAKITRDTLNLLSNYKKRNTNKTRTDLKFEEKVALIKFYPGQDPDILEYYRKKGYKGIVIEMTGLGHVATKRARKGWTKKLKQIQDRGIVICAASQCINGRLDPLVYSNGLEIFSTGVIYLEDMLAETALVKLGWVLGHKEWAKNKDEVKKMMLRNIAGEFSDRLEN